MQNDRTYKRGTTVLGSQSEVKDHNILDHPNTKAKDIPLDHPSPYCP